MCQKGKIVAWRLIGLLFVLSIGISFFAMSPILALADTQASPVIIPIATRNTVLLGVWRPDGSTVGSVRITDKTAPNRLDQCVNLSQQNTVYGFGNIHGQDTVTIAQYPGANCQGSDNVSRDPNKTYTGTVNSLPPGSTDGKYRLYQTPKDA